MCPRSFTRNVLYCFRTADLFKMIEAASQMFPLFDVGCLIKQRGLPFPEIFWLGTTENITGKVDI